MSGADSLVSGVFSSAFAQQIQQAAAAASTITSSQSWHKNSTVQQQTTPNLTQDNQKPIVAFGNGYVFTNADKQLFAHAVVQFCAQDMHNYDVVEVFKYLKKLLKFSG